MKQIFALLFFILFFNPILLVGQKSPCWDIYYSAEKDTIKDAKGNYNYKKALEKINAIYLCLESFKNKDADSIRKKTNLLNIKIYNNINDAKILANRATNEVEKSLVREKKAKEQAIIEKNNAQALYWTSQAEKIIPIQSMRLLEKAYKKTKDVSTINNIRDESKIIFQKSNTHQWRKKKMFENISEIKFSPDSKWLLVIRKNHHYEVWNTSMQNHYDLYYKNDNDKIGGVDFSCDSKWLIISSLFGKRKKVLQVDDGKISSFLNSENNIYDLSFSSNGKWLISIDTNYRAKVWQLDTLRSHGFLSKNEKIEKASFSKNDKWLLTLDKEHHAKVWEVNTGRLHYSLKDENNILNATLSPDGKWLVTLDEEKKLKIWDVSKRALKFHKNNMYTWDVSFSSDSNLIIVVDTTKNVEVWDINKDTVLEFLKNDKNIIEAKFSPDYNWLITRDSTFNTKIRNIDNGQVPNLLKNENNIRDAFFSPDCSWLITIYDSTASSKAWSFRSGVLYDVLKDDQPIFGVGFSNDSKWVKTNKLFSTSKVWQIKEGIFLDLFKNENNIFNPKFSPNSKWLITTEDEEQGIQTLWEITSDEITNISKSHKEIKTSSLSSDGKWIIIENFDDSINILATTTWQVPYFLRDIKNIKKASFDYNSQWLVIQKQYEEYVEVWDLKNERPAEFLIGKERYTNISFSSDGKWFIGSKFLGNTDILQVDSGEKLDCIKDKNIFRASFSPDSKFLAILTGIISDITIWQVEQQKDRTPSFLKGINNYVSVSFSADNKWIVTREKLIGNFLKIRDINNGESPKFIENEDNIAIDFFSPDGKWFVSSNDIFRQNTKIRNIENGIPPFFMKNENGILQLEFSKNAQFLVIRQNGSHQVKTYDTFAGKLIQTLWLNKVPTDIDIINNRYLYVTVGKAIVKTDLQTQQGNLMSYGDGEPLDYKFEEIQEWIKAFGDKYLLPLDEEIKKKYGVD
ncbi:WD40 repeat domain-containing protein [Arcicella lustrica]|uniref:WD40 repeat n=1 Tax=Arcicella lustrica TaxID=2984196 RepID=A0ABU5SLZ4_9BACT|nr:hypothetical protein [Arcicella sp. DC25W]MEA5428273.1 hypothetical protein [Arcicella sp. DC25W]